MRYYASRQYRIVQAIFILLLPTLTFIGCAQNTAEFVKQKQQASSVQPAQKGQSTNTTFPNVDPQYIYDQLALLSTTFQHRESGYDSLSSNVSNGHDGFANYWMHEMLGNLPHIGATVQKDRFPIKGWKDRPATKPGTNVEITVPGALHPEQSIYIGCHYDGMAFSTGSAYDDTSGCAIELGVAKAMGSYWSSNHLFPQRTLRFILFDTEEQGLFGSYHYINQTVNGQLNNVVAMFNEEQNGIAYPLRFLGQAKNPLLPLTINVSVPHAGTKITQQQRANMSGLSNAMKQAIPAVFQQFRTLGIQSVSYHSAEHTEIQQPVFSTDQLKYVKQEAFNMDGSDNQPFNAANLPTATFVGDSSYYDEDQLPAWSYPYDQPQDTLQLMNTYATGGTQRSAALTLALALPGMLTTWMLQHTGGSIPLAQLAGAPIAAISDIGNIKPGQTSTFQAQASFNPQGADPLLYTWNFGDGTQANGISVQHRYQEAKVYMLLLTVKSRSGTRTIQQNITIGNSNTYGDPYTNDQSILDGQPHSNPVIKQPTPQAGAKDSAIYTPGSPWSITQS